MLALRERNTAFKALIRVARTNNAPSKKHFSSSSISGNASLALQLDYYMSPQFAGVACALVGGSYANKGIDLKFLPICPVGLEQHRVRDYQNANPSHVTIGSVEQNIFIPTLYRNPDLKVKCIAAMLHQSPLCITSLKKQTAPLTIGVHEDTVELMERIFPEHKVMASPRSTKTTDLISGKVDAIQAYTTTENPALRMMGHEPHFTSLEGTNRAKLGYGQALFTTEENLESNDSRQTINEFCDATFKGWEYAIKHPELAVEMVEEAKKMLSDVLEDENNDHWHSSKAFNVEMLKFLNEFVKPTFQGDRYGVINANRFNDATQWLLDGNSTNEGFGLDDSAWQPAKGLLCGNALARQMLEDAKASAESFAQTHGRKPSLAVVTVGELDRYTQSERRLEIYSDQSRSWFSKTTTGESNGFDVEEINLEASKTTTEDLLKVLNQLKNDGNNKVYDGIQLMWPLPDHIDTSKVYNAIDITQDVDGIHYIGQIEIGNKHAYAPVTPLAVIKLIEEYTIDVVNKRVLVVGRSPIVGSPVAHMLREKGAAVTIVHSQISQDLLKDLTQQADVIVSCAGKPGVIQAEWIGLDSDTAVISVGTTFVPDLDRLVSDVEGDIEKYAKQYSPVPGGIGPTSIGCLLNNVAQAAWNNAS